MTKRITGSGFYEKEADENSYLYFNKVNGINMVATVPHFHDSIELVLAIKGECVIHINGTKITLNVGDCAFIDCFDVHYYEYFPKSEYYVFLVSEKYLNNTNGFDKKKLSMFLPKCKKYEKFKELFDSVYNLWESSKETFRSGFVNIILGFLSEQYPLIERESNGDVKILVNTLLYINENFSKDITLEFLSNKFGYSKNYFSTLFNKFTGMNLREYINQRRIIEFERIKNLKVDQPVYTLAQECGFKSLKTFYRAYNKFSEKQS